MEKNKPIIDYETYDSVDEKKEKPSENVAVAKDSTKKKSMNKKIVIAIVSFMLIAVLLIVGITVYSQLNKPSSGSLQNNNNVHETINNETKGTTNAKSYASGPKVPVPDGDVALYSLSQSALAMSKVNDANLSYLNEIREAVLAFKNGKTTSAEFEQDLLKFKSNLSTDINMFAKYRAMYELYENESTYETEMMRFQNEYELVNNMSSAMTSGAIITTFNYHIEQEIEYNRQVVENMKVFFEKHGIEYTAKNGFIQYDINSIKK